jgi:hypothetical protein
LDKDLELWLTDKFDTRTKQPTDEAIIVKFDKINRRPAAPKVTANYAIGADYTGTTTGDWVLVPRGRGADTSKAVKDNIEIAATLGMAGKVIDEFGYGRFFPGETNGIPIKEFNGNKSMNSAYFVRYAPRSDGTIHTAASRSTRVSARSEQRPTRVRADYKKEIIKLKNGDMVFAGKHDDLGNVYTYGNTSEANLTEGTLLNVIAARGATVSISDYLSAEPETLVIWRPGTNRSPATAKQVYQLAPRASIVTEVVNGEKGKVKLDRQYEVRSNTSNRWGKLPRVNASTTKDVRIRPTARGNGSIDTGFAASASGTIGVDHGIFDETRNRSGILRAKISPGDGTTFSITDVVVLGNTVSAEITAGRGAYLDITAYVDDTGMGGEMSSLTQLASGRILLEEAIESDFVDVAVSPSLPSHFIIIARLTDQNGNDLCDPFISIKNTRAWDDFEATTVADFIADGRADDVINLPTGDSTTNFMVVSDGVLNINTDTPGVNDLATVDGTSVYIFSNADSAVQSLKVGDKVAVTSGIDVFLITVSRVTVSGSTVTITSSDNNELTEFFDFIKVNLKEQIDPPTPIAPITMSTSDSMSIASTSDIMPLTSTLWSYRRDFNRVVNAGSEGNIELDAWVGLRLYLVAEISYSVQWKLIVPVGINLYAKIGIGAEAEAGVAIDNTDKPTNHTPTEIEIFKGRLPIGYGFNVSCDITLVIDWSAVAKGGASAFFSVEAGVIYNNGSIQTYTTRTSTLNPPTFEGSFSMSIGPRITASIDWLGLVTASVWVHPKVVLNARVYLGIAQPFGAHHHACRGCADGSVDFVVDAGFRVSYNILVLKGTIVDATYPRIVNVRIIDFYVSFINHRDSVHWGQVRVGTGRCPNLAYETTFNPLNSFDNTVQTASVTVRNSSGTVVGTGSGRFTGYLYPSQFASGTYSASALADGFVFQDRTFTVGNQPQTVRIPADQLQPQSPISIVSPGTRTYGDADFRLSTTGGSGSGGITYAVTNGNAVSVTTDGIAAIRGAGIVTIRATKAGDNRFLPAETFLTFTVNKRSLAGVSVGFNGDFIYNGTAQTPTPIVTDGANIIRLGADYTVGHSNNRDAGTATVTITATENGNYTGSRAASFTIVPATLIIRAPFIGIAEGASLPTLRHEISGFAVGENESVLTGQPILTTSYTQGMPNGNYEILISLGTLAARNYAFAPVNGNLAVGLLPQSTFSIVHTPGARTYGDVFTVSTAGGSTGGAVTFTQMEGIGMVDNGDGTATITVRQIGDISIRAVMAGNDFFEPAVSETITFTTVRRQITITPHTGQTKVFGDLDPVFTYGYNPSPLHFDDVFTGNLGRGTGNTVGVPYTYNLGNLSAGNGYTLVLGGSAYFRITGRQISNASITPITDRVFNNSNHVPSLTLTDLGRTLTLNVDYNVTYSNNRNVGDAMVTITGIGNYSGTATTTFRITKAQGGVPNNNTGRLLESVGNRTFTVPVMTTTNTEQTVQYFVSDEPNLHNITGGIAESAWSTDRTFTNRDNITYYLYVRTRESDNYREAIREFPISHTGWSGTVNYNVTNSTSLGTVSLRMRVNGTWQNIREIPVSSTGNSGNLTLAFDFAPWAIQDVGLTWNHPTFLGGIFHNFGFSSFRLEIANAGINRTWWQFEDGSNNNSGSHRSHDNQIFGGTYNFTYAWP